jgi:hypothetical protein
MATYSITPEACILSYTWQTPPGMIIIDGQGTEQIDVELDNNFSGGSVTVILQKTSGTETLSLPVSNIPFTPVFDYSTSCVNPGFTVPFSVIPMVGVDSYVWTAPVNSNILYQYGSQIDSVRIKFGAAFTTGTLSVQATNNCGTSPALEIELATPPAIPGVITGSTIVCNVLGSQPYSVNPVPLADYYIWTMPTGATITSAPVDSASILISFNNFISGAISVKSANQCGSSTMRYLTINTQSLAPAASISGPTNVCTYINSGTATYSTPIVSGVTSYNWTVPAGATIVSGAGTNTVGVQFSGAFTGGNISVSLFNGCSISSPKSLALTASTSASLGAISGPTSVCQNIGGSTVTYSVAAVAGAQSYNWSFANGTGASIISGNTTNTITVQYSAGYVQDTLKLTMVSNCGPNGYKNLFIRSTPGTTSAISGPACISAGSTYTYSVSPVTGATSYTWSVPTGATILSGQNTTSISVTYSSSFAGGSIQLTASNSCGSSAPVSLGVGYTPAIPLSISGLTTVCANTTYTYSVPPVIGATYYIWQVPSGMSIIGPSDGTSINVLVSSSFISGKISCKSATACGSSTMRYSSLISMGTCGAALVVQDQNEPQILQDEMAAIPYNKAFVSQVLNDTILIAVQEDRVEDEITIMFFEDSNGSLLWEDHGITYEGLNQFELDVRELSPGTYQLIIVNKSGEIRLRKQVVIPLK